MGLKADETIQLTPEELLGYLRSKTRVFMDIDEDQYYITHTDGYWRVQDCSQMNEKGRFSDCSELVPTLSELFELPWRDGKSVHDLCTEATFFESVQDGWGEARITADTPPHPFPQRTRRHLQSNRRVRCVSAVWLLTVIRTRTTFLWLFGGFCGEIPA